VELVQIGSNFFNAFFPTWLASSQEPNWSRILPLEELYARKKFPRSIGPAPDTGVLFPPEDGLRQMICTFSETS